MQREPSKSNIVSSFNCLSNSSVLEVNSPASIQLCRPVTKTLVTDAAFGSTRASNSTCSPFLPVTRGSSPFPVIRGLIGHQALVLLWNASSRQLPRSFRRDRFFCSFLLLFHPPHRRPFNIAVFLCGCPLHFSCPLGMRRCVRPNSLGVLQIKREHTLWRVRRWLRYDGSLL